MGSGGGGGSGGGMATPFGPSGSVGYAQHPQYAGATTLRRPSSGGVRMASPAGGGYGGGGGGGGGMAMGMGARMGVPPPTPGSSVMTLGGGQQLRLMVPPPTPGAPQGHGHHVVLGGSGSGGGRGTQQHPRSGGSGGHPFGR
jgi:hypothetical protein